MTHQKKTRSAAAECIDRLIELKKLSFIQPNLEIDATAGAVKLTAHGTAEQTDAYRWRISVHVKPERSTHGQATVCLYRVADWRGVGRVKIQDFTQFACNDGTALCEGLLSLTMQLVDNHTYEAYASQSITLQWGDRPWMFNATLGDWIILLLRDVQFFPRPTLETTDLGRLLRRLAIEDTSERLPEVQAFASHISQLLLRFLHIKIG